jgi:hypothetical protein
MDELERPKIHASFIVEMMGKPPEHLDETLKRLVDKIGTDKGVKIVDKRFFDPKKVEQKAGEKEAGEKLKEKVDDKRIQVLHDIFTCFAEIDAEFDNMESLIMTAFTYMPSNIQVTYPENFVMKNNDIDSILTTIVLKLHKYDDLAKKFTIERALLENKLREMMEKDKKD